MTSKCRTTVVAMLFSTMLLFVPHGFALAQQGVDKDSLETKTRQLSDAVEHLQADIVEDLTSVKEKQLFRIADQVLHDLAKMEKLLGKRAPAREELYQHFDKIDADVELLGKAVRELVPQRYLLIIRGAQRVHILTDDLHYAVSKGDASPMRVRQVIARQARAMTEAAKKLSLAAEYALGGTPGRGELLVDLKKLAEACKPFEAVAATTQDLEKCKKEFVNLNDAWQRVVHGISLLGPTENAYLIRSAVRADTVHERLFRIFGIKGERPQVTIRI